MDVGAAIVFSVLIFSVGIVAAVVLIAKYAWTKPAETVTLSIKDVASETVRTAGNVSIKFSEDLRSVAEKCVSAGEGVVNNFIALFRTPEELNAQIHAGAISFEPKLVVMEARVFIQAEYKGRFDRWMPQKLDMRDPIHTHMFYPVRIQFFVRLRDVKFKPFSNAMPGKLILSVPDIELEIFETGLTDAKITKDIDCSYHLDAQQAQKIKEKCWKAICKEIPDSADVDQLKSVARRAALPMIDSLLVRNRIVQPLEILLVDKAGDVVEDLSHNLELNKKTKPFSLGDEDIKRVKE